MVDKSAAGISAGTEKFLTPLEAFLKARKLRPAHVARAAGCSRQHLLRLRKGIAEPTRPMMIAITRACRKLSKRRVRMADLFAVGSDDR